MRTGWSDLPDGLNESARRLVEELRALKDASRLSLTQISAQTHYSRASWERWLNGKRLVTPIALTAFAEATGAEGTVLLELLRRAEQDLPVESADGPADGPDSIEPSPAVEHEVGAGAGGSRIAQLPAGIGDFTGRESEIRTLTDLLAGPRPGAGQLPVAVVFGGGGVGKSTLATHVAHLVAERFPDGQIYADLRGADPAPRAPADVLADWLRALGEPAENIPPSVEARSARFRSLTHRRSLLLLLDDAHDSVQVRPLLPASETCAVLVTSRNGLASLVGARRIGLDAMSDDDARALLEAIVGARRLGGEPEATSTILDSCAGLPLALRIAGTRLETRPGWQVRTLADRMADQHRLLDELAVDDLAARVSFQVSYTMLSSGRADPRSVPSDHAFRLLGLAATPDVSLPAAAALFGTDADSAEYALETLVDTHLLETRAPLRYRFHDLIRLYAAECVEQDEPAEESDKALRRMLHWYTAATILAGSLMYPGNAPLPLPELADAPQPLELADADEALAWFEQEWENLVAAAALAYRSGHYSYGWILPISVYPFLLMRSSLDQWFSLAETGLLSAERGGDTYGRSRLLNLKAGVLFQLEQLSDAAHTYELALVAARECGNRIGESVNLTNLCMVYRMTGRFERALECGLQARSLERELGRRNFEAMALNNVAAALCELGRLDEALANVDEAVSMCGVGRDIHLGVALTTQAEIRRRRGRTDEAAESFEQAVAAFHEVGHLRNEAATLEAYGDFLLENGRQKRAATVLRECLRLLEDLGDPHLDKVRALLETM